MGYDVVAVGELLIDFTGSGASGRGNPLFEASPGNALAMLASLGKRITFIDKVGDDMFGRLLRDALAEVGISADGVVTDEGANTTLAFVQTGPE